MYQRLLNNHLSRNRPFCLLGAAGVGKTTLIGEFAGKFSNWIHLDLNTTADRSIFSSDQSNEDTIKAISFLKDKEIRGKGTLIVLDEIGKCAGAMKWAGDEADRRSGGQGDHPLLAMTSSVLTPELSGLLTSGKGDWQTYYLYPFSFEEFLMAMDDRSALDAFREVPVPYYAYEKLLGYFHLYALIGGMPDIIREYAATRHLAPLKRLYAKLEAGFIQSIGQVTASLKSSALASEVMQNTYPYAATRISFNRFGNIEKGSREISMAFKALGRTFLLQLIHPVASIKLPLAHDTSRFPRLHLLDTGLVNYFSGIQKPLFQSHDMNAIFDGQIARQVVGQEILANGIPGATDVNQLNFWIRNKAQSTAEVDFVIPYNDLLIPVVVKIGEPGRLRSLHQFIDQAPHAYAVRLYAGKLAVQQTQTIRGKKFYLMNLPYFLAGKIKDHLKGFIRLTGGT